MCKVTRLMPGAETVQNVGVLTRRAGMDGRPTARR
jgi:hypothetical protein